jgi:uncharacterized cupin superfamily protein
MPGRHDEQARLEPRDQPLSETAHTEMGPRESWNQKNPPVEAVIVRGLKTTELVPRPYRNTKARFFRLGGGRRLQAHVSELPPGGRSVKHRHTTEAVIYIVCGQGYSVLSWDGDDEQRVDWQEGDVFSFPLWMWHQHFNASSTDVCRYLAVQDTLAVKALGLHQIERSSEE